LSIGFGLERLGLLTLKFPRTAAILVLAVTAMFLAQFPRLNIDGDLLRMYRGSGIEYEQYINLRETFGTFENDAYVLVTSDKLTEPAVLERLRELAFELELNEFAFGTLSPFSLRQPSEQEGQTVPAVPENMQTRAEVAAALTDLRENDPMMRNLVMADNRGLVMILFPNQEMIAEFGDDGMIASLRELVADYESPDYNIELTGPPVWTSELIKASLQDQFVFTVSGMILGFLTSFLVFRSFWGAFLATLTPLLSVLWVLGGVTLLFGSFTFLTNIVTALVMVIAFAESLYFCFYWMRLWNEGEDPYDAIRQTVERVSPACALTSITTVIAFGSLGITQSQAIQEFAASGALAVAIAYVALVTFLPLALRFAVRMGFKPKRSPSVAVTAMIPMAWSLAKKHAKIVLPVSIVFFLLLLIPHFSLRPDFSFRDFLPKGSEALETSSQIDEGVGGVAPIYISLRLEDGVADVTDKDFATIQLAHSIAEENFGKNKVISAASFTFYADSGFTRAQIFDAVGPFLKRRFITDDGTMAMVTAFTPTNTSSQEIQDIVIKLRADLAAAGIDSAQVAGFRVLSSFGSVKMIRSLQQGLTLAVVLAIILIGIAFRSWKMALISIIPNFLPILGTELYLWLSGQGLQITTVISLTIAFGIAVDDTIHFLAHYQRARQLGIDVKESVERTLNRVGPALVATTLILCAGNAVVIFSALPQVALFGTLTVLTLLFALLGDLFILPSILIGGAQWYQSIGRKKNDLA